MNDIGHVIHNYFYHDQGKYCDIKLVNGGGGGHCLIICHTTDNHYKNVVCACKTDLLHNTI